MADVAGPRDAAQGVVEGLDADQLEHLVRPLRPRAFAEALVVDDAAVGAGGLQLFERALAATGGDDARADGLGQLHGGHADGARGAAHQEGVTGLEPEAFEERAVGGEVGLGDGRERGPI